MRRPSFAAALTCLVIAAPGLAQWPDDPAINVEIAAGSGDRVQPKLGRIPGGAGGGTYVSWFGGSGFDVGLQRVDAHARLQWPGGVVIADRGFSSTQDYDLAVDASGHALLVFRDDRPGGVQITATRVDVEGNQVWGDMGVQLTDTGAFVAAPKIAPLSDGTIMVAWTQDSDVVVQRLDADGVPQWAPPVSISDPGGAGLSASDLVVANAGSAILSFIRQDGFPAPRHLFAQKIATDGSLEWGAAHVTIFNTGSLQFGNFPTFVTDRAGGGVFAWYSSSPSLQCYAQRVLSGGTLAFPAGGVPVSTNGSRIRTSPAVTYQSPSTFVFWREQNIAQSQSGIFGQRLDATGARQWTDDGVEIVPVGSTEHTQVRAELDGGSGDPVAFFVDAPDPPPAHRVLATRLDHAGNFVWDGDIVELSTVDSSKSRLVATYTSNDTFVTAWQDDRGGDDDVYAQNLRAEDGTLGSRPTDINDDGFVAFLDLLEILSNWGPCPGPIFCEQDVNGDGVVDFADLLLVLSDWS